MGLLLALSAAFSFIETQLPVPLPLGVKPGLSSIPIMYAIFRLDSKSALMLCVLKSVFVLLTRSPTAFFMSVCGALLSLAVMLLLAKKTSASVALISVTGGVFHNIGQLCACTIIMQSTFTLSYLPVLVIAGCISGLFTGGCLQGVFKALDGAKPDNPR